MSYLWSYGKYFFRARTAHGLHSPLAYKLYNEVIHAKGAIPAEKILEPIRRSLQMDGASIDVLDLGAGSRTSTRPITNPAINRATGENKISKRKISEIARNALKPKKLALLLYRLAAWHKPEVIVEIGTSLGITSAYLALAVPEATVISIEGSEEIAKIARETHQKAKVAVEVLTGNFDDVLPKIFETLKTDNFMIFIDGNHQYMPTLTYFEMALKKAGQRTLLVFDDIHWSHQMERAWLEIQKSPKATFTADLFYLGIVLTERTRAKQNFIIKI